jgi:hypothetical protein
MRILLLATAIIFFSISSTFAQAFGSGNNQVIVKGTVTDEYTGAPAQSTIEFKDKTGKKIKVTSNSKDGFYTQILNGGEEYEVIFSGNDVFREITTISLPSVQKVEEKVINFKVKKLTPGLPIFKISGFDRGSTKLNAQSTELINKLQEAMKFNRQVKFAIVVCDDYSAPAAPKAESNEQPKNKQDKKTSKDKKNKKDTKKKPEKEVTTPAKPATPVGSESIINKRIAAVEQQLESWQRFKERITVKGDKNYQTQGSTSCNFIIVVESIDDTFK